MWHGESPKVCNIHDVDFDFFDVEDLSIFESAQTASAHSVQQPSWSFSAHAATTSAPSTRAERRARVEAFLSVINPIPSALTVKKESSASHDTPVPWAPLVRSYGQTVEALQHTGIKTTRANRQAAMMNYFAAQRAVPIKSHL